MLLVPLSFLLPVDASMRVLMIVSVLGVMIVELLNSAVEAVVDYISMEKHPLAKRAKDMGSAAVLMSLLSCGAVWATALYPLLFG